MQQERGEQDQCVTANDYTTYGEQIDKTGVVLTMKRENETNPIKITTKRVRNNSQSEDVGEGTTQIKQKVELGATDDYEKCTGSRSIFGYDRTSKVM